MPKKQKLQASKYEKTQDLITSKDATEKVTLLHYVHIKYSSLLWVS